MAGLNTQAKDIKGLEVQVKSLPVIDTMTLEELEQRINELKSIWRDADKEISNLSNIQWSKVKQKVYPQLSTFVGKCFKRKQTGYGDYYLYAKIIGLDKDQIYGTHETPEGSYNCLFFSTTTRNVIEIKHYQQQIAYLGEEITLEEYNTAWEELKTRINNMQEV
jgi:hypothetical protein